MLFGQVQFHFEDDLKPVCQTTVTPKYILQSNWSLGDHQQKKCNGAYMKLSVCLKNKMSMVLRMQGGL